ncbi:hypothetical protein VM1G_03254 [Cytospora mali]|uniref:Uncharacterized protein n=1 Tax=Cytospora mali TaxID=578113 RepID=A0A194VSR8_CYTMA|nr:hypothetical protein VM1G_03254 [Valsa mali]
MLWPNWAALCREYHLQRQAFACEESSFRQKAKRQYDEDIDASGISGREHQLSLGSTGPACTGRSDEAQPLEAYFLNEMLTELKAVPTGALTGGLRVDGGEINMVW